MTLSPHRSPQWDQLHGADQAQAPALWRTRRGGVLVSVALLVVLVLATTVVLGFGPRRGAMDAATKAAASTPASAHPVPSTVSSAAATPDQAAGRGLIAPPSGITWTLYRTRALPTSPTAGPTRISGPVYAGYAHTPTGSLIAAVQISTRDFITTGDGWRSVVKAQVLPGAGRDQYGNLRAQATSDAIPAAGWTQIVGFRFITYTDTVAVISIAERSSAGGYQVSDQTVHWADGDWKLEIPASGNDDVQVVANIVGYVPWSGVS